MCRERSRARRAHRLRSSLRSPQIGVRLRQFALRLLDLRGSGGGGGTRRLHTRCPCLGRRYGCVILLLRDFLLVDQLLVPHEIALRFGIVSFRLRDLCLGRFKLLARCGDSRLGIRCVRLRGRNLARRTHTRYWNIDPRGGRLRLGVGIVGTRLLHRDLVISRVDLHQYSSFLHILIVFNVELNDVSADPRTD